MRVYTKWGPAEIGPMTCMCAICGDLSCTHGTSLLKPDTEFRWMTNSRQIAGFCRNHYLQFLKKGWKLLGTSNDYHLLPVAITDLRVPIEEELTRFVVQRKQTQRVKD